MIMTEKLANTLMETLACVAISAFGSSSPEVLQFAQDYAKENFTRILEFWEDMFGEKWEIKVDK